MPRERQALDFLAASQPQMPDLLRRIVDIDSGSNHKQGVDAVINVLRSLLGHHGVRCEIHSNADAGNCMPAH